MIFLCVLKRRIHPTNKTDYDDSSSFGPPKMIDHTHSFAKHIKA